MNNPEPSPQVARHRPVVDTGEVPRKWAEHLRSITLNRLMQNGASDILDAADMLDAVASEIDRLQAENEGHGASRRLLAKENDELRDAKMRQPPIWSWPTCCALILLVAAITLCAIFSK